MPIGRLEIHSLAAEQEDMIEMFALSVGKMILRDATRFERRGEKLIAIIEVIQTEEQFKKALNIE